MNANKVSFGIGAVAAVALAAFGGCAVLEDQIDRAAGAAARAVEAYCANFTPDQRAEFGNRVRERASPHDVRVTCQ